jgi:hypothetical protein
MERSWREVHAERWESSDGAVVKYDRSTMLSTAKPWLPNHRGWMAFGPGQEQFNYLGYWTKRRFKIPRKFKTPAAGMGAVNREYPAK